MSENIKPDVKIGIKMFLQKVNDIGYFVTTKMSSTIVTVHNEKYEFQIKRYMPTLEAAPDFSHLQPLPKEMPVLTAKPKLSNIKKRRNSEYYPKAKQTTHISLDDSVIVNDRKRRRTKQEIIDDHINEFKEKQKTALAQFCKASDSETQKACNLIRPRIKTVNHDFRQISNIAFAVCRQQKIIYKCISNWCEYKTLIVNDFKCHLINFHKSDSTLKPHSLCQICKTETNARSFEEELHHMNFHLKSIQILEKPNEEINLDELIEILNADQIIPVPTESIEKVSVSEKIPTSGLDNLYGSIEDEIKKLHSEASPTSNNNKITILSVENLPKLDILSKQLLEAENNEPKIILIENQRRDIEFTKNSEEKKSVDEESVDLSETKSSTDVSKKNEIANLDLEWEISAKDPNSSESTENKNDLLKIKLRRRSSTFESPQIKKRRMSEACCREESFPQAKDDPKASQTSENILSALRTKRENLIKEILNTSNLPKENGHLSPGLTPQQCLQNTDQLEASSQQQKILIDSKPEERQIFKRSLSVSKVLEKQQTQVKPTPESKRTERLSSDFISKLIGEEKSVGLPQMKPEIKPEPAEKTSEIFDVLKKATPQELMPWADEIILRKNVKFQICYNRMKQPSSLVKLFKCMDMKCSFATSNNEKFYNHLIRHAADKKQDNQFYLYCSYCCLRAHEVKSLVHHINDVHRYDSFQCSHCFYRSREKEACYHHTRLIHKDKSHSILKAVTAEESEQVKEQMMRRLEKKRKDNVSPYSCQLCKLIFYPFNEMLDHFQDHYRRISSGGSDREKAMMDNALIIRDEAVKFNTYGMYECLFCKKGFMSKIEMSQHMVHHPSEPHFCCVRQEPATLRVYSNSSIESTFIKRIDINDKIEIIDLGQNDEGQSVDNDFKKIVDPTLSKYLCKLRKQ